VLSWKIEAKTLFMHNVSTININQNHSSKNHSSKRLIETNFWGIRSLDFHQILGLSLCAYTPKIIKAGQSIVHLEIYLTFFPLLSWIAPSRHSDSPSLPRATLLYRSEWAYILNFISHLFWLNKIIVTLLPSLMAVDGSV